MFKTHLTKTWIVIELDLQIQNLFYATFMQILCHVKSGVSRVIYHGKTLCWLTGSTLSYNFNAEAASN